MTEGPDDVEDGVAGLETVHQLGGLADSLDDEGDGARVRVGARDRERDSLAAVVQADDDELSRELLARDARRDDAEQLDVGGEEPGFVNGEHRPRVRGQGSGFRNVVQVLADEWLTEYWQFPRHAYGSGGASPRVP